MSEEEEQQAWSGATQAKFQASSSGNSIRSSLAAPVRRKHGGQPGRHSSRLWLSSLSPLLLDHYCDRAAKAVDSRMGAIKRCLDGIDFSTDEEKEEQVKHVASELRESLRAPNGTEPASIYDEEYSFWDGLRQQIKTDVLLQVKKMMADESDTPDYSALGRFDNRLAKILPGAAILETLQRRLEIQERLFGMTDRFLEEVNECCRQLTRLLIDTSKDHSDQQEYQYQELVEDVARAIRDLEREAYPIAGAFAEDGHDIITRRCSALQEALFTMVQKLAGPQEKNQEKKLEVAGIMVNCIMVKLKAILETLPRRLEIQERLDEMTDRFLEEVDECNRQLTGLLSDISKDHSDQQGYQYQELVEDVARAIRDLEREAYPIAGAFAEDGHDIITRRCSALKNALFAMVQILAGRQEKNQEVDQEDWLQVAGIMVKRIMVKLKDICKDVANRCQEGD